jgi:hypothetical protein
VASGHEVTGIHIEKVQMIAEGREIRRGNSIRRGFERPVSHQPLPDVGGLSEVRERSRKQSEQNE